MYSQEIGHNMLPIIARIYGKYLKLCYLLFFKLAYAIMFIYFNIQSTFVFFTMF